MAAQTSRLAAVRPARLFTIGQVLSVLSPDFPDLTPSKLRFLEEQGLVTPQRTASGYRKFTDNDVDRIRVILQLQRDQYLPLKVIRGYLTELDEGKTPSLPSANSHAPARLRADSKARFDLSDLLAEASISAALVAEAQELQLLGQEPFTMADLEIARAIVHLQRFGIAPRHLRGIKAAADREIGLIEGVVAPVLGKNDTSSRSRAAHYALEIENQFATIRSELIRNVISKIDE